MTIAVESTRAGANRLMVDSTTDGVDAAGAHAGITAALRKTGPIAAAI